jgi:hypothetical protein
MSASSRVRGSSLQGVVTVTHSGVFAMTAASVADELSPKATNEIGMSRQPSQGSLKEFPMQAPGSVASENG